MFELNEIMDTHYEKLLAVTTTSGRKYREKIMLSLLIEHPELKEYWEYNDSEYSIVKRFQRKKKEKEWKPEFPWEENNSCGLYLIGTTTFNPYTDECFYWIKIGQTTNLSQRIKQYKTHNPAIWISDFYPIKFTAFLDMTEQRYHNLLSIYKIQVAENTKEWFQVSKEDYLIICEKGFKIFD